MFKNRNVSEKLDMLSALNPTFKCKTQLHVFSVVGKFAVLHCYIT